MKPWYSYLCQLVKISDIMKKVRYDNLNEEHRIVTVDLDRTDKNYVLKSALYDAFRMVVSPTINENKCFEFKFPKDVDINALLEQTVLLPKIIEI